MLKQRNRIIAFSIFIVLLFCSSFVYFYQRAQQRTLSSAKEVDKPKEIDKPLPEAHLVDITNNKLEERFVRNGKVVLVFVTADCDACKREAEFLRTIINSNDDVQFYGVISYGDKKGSLTAAEEIFPFKVFYDEGFKLAGALGINRVPVKIFLEDGVIKKAWGGATTDEERQAAFVSWLDELR